MIKHNKIWFPDHDNECWIKNPPQLKDEVKWLIPYVKDKSICVQAGANVGLWPNKLANYFESVYTFEPSPDNLECLRANGLRKNVYLQECGLSNKIGSMGNHIVNGNSGANYLDDGNDTEVITIDSLKLSSCGLIFLDIEGMEFLALKGGEETISKYHPVLCYEDKGLSYKRKSFNVPEGEVRKYFEKEHGYRYEGTKFRQHLLIYKK